MKYIALMFLLCQFSTIEAQSKLSKADKRIITEMEKSFKAYQNKDFDKALELLEPMLLKDLIKQDYRSYIFLGNIHFANKDFKAARSAYIKSLEVSNNLAVDRSLAYIGLNRSGARIENDILIEKQVAEMERIKDSVANSGGTNKTFPAGSFSYELVATVPVYPGCDEAGQNQDLKKCMQQSIAEFIVKNFRTDLGSVTGLAGRVQIDVQFKVLKTGAVEIMNVRSLHPLLEEEAIRVVELLPKLKPGILRGEPVDVIYGLPIIFEIK